MSLRGLNADVQQLRACLVVFAFRDRLQDLHEIVSSLGLVGCRAAENVCPRGACHLPTLLNAKLPDLDEVNIGVVADAAMTDPHIAVEHYIAAITAEAGAALGPIILCRSGAVMR
jgi:hypothetical protein